MMWICDMYQGMQGELKEVIDPKARHVFLDDTGVTEALSLRGIAKDSFLVESLGEITKTDVRKGYFVSSDKSCIVRFTCRIMAMDEEGKGHAARRCELKVDLSSLKRVDRRQFPRHQMKSPLPITFNFDDQFIRAYLVNISDGGMRMALDHRLPAHVTYEFDLKLPDRHGSLRFKTDGLVVYCEPEADPKVFITGVMFVAPHFRHEGERIAYQNEKINLSRYLAENPQMFVM